jgi:hypothetical protein
MFLTSENLIKNLLCSFPELEDEVTNVIEWTGGKYNHIIFAQAFVPYIKKNLI